MYGSLQVWVVCFVRGLFSVATSPVKFQALETELKECKRRLPSSISGAEPAMTVVTARARQASGEMV